MEATVAVRTSITFFLLSSVLDGRTEIRDYDPNIAVPIPGSEPEYTWYTWAVFLLDTELGSWGLGGSGLGNAPYLGQLIAGQAEFPWVVDVRNLDHDQEGWGIGNLVSSKWVVTVAHLALLWAEGDAECGPSEQVQYVVYFCTNYLHEDWFKYDENGRPINNLFSGRDSRGTRTVTQFIKHPECTRWSREWDGMMLKLSIPIEPVPPVIGYMPVWGFYDGYYTDGDYSFIPRPERREYFGISIYDQICYVATYGRALYNIAKPPSQDWKLRYRVYSVPWTKCHDAKKDLCAKVINLKTYVDEVCEFFFDQCASAWGFYQCNCFEIRSGNGAICEHDVGAPLVCLDQVAGWVVRGAPFSHCRSGKPYPFVVNFINNFDRNFLTGKRPPASTFHRWIGYTTEGGSFTWGVPPTPPWKIVKGGNLRLAEEPGRPQIQK